jgi:hypothetical protein
VSKAVLVDEDKLEHWKMRAEKAAGALKTAMSQKTKVLIWDCKDDPVLIWETLKTLFIWQCTVPRFNVYHALLSVKKSESELLDSLINRVDEHIRVIKSLSLGHLFEAPFFFFLNKFYSHSSKLWTVTHGSEV